MPWFRELELERHGAKLITPEKNVALLAGDGRTLEWWTDFEKTVRSFEQFSEEDAATLRKWRDSFRPIVEGILVPEAVNPPVPPETRTAELERSRDGRLLLETSALSPVEFVRREFRHPVIQAGLLFFNGLREVDLRLPGFGHHIPSLLASGRYAQMCEGGSARLAEALVSAISESGGDFETGVEIEEILVENGRASGVRLEDGRIYRANRLVASGLNPQQTFLDLLPDVSDHQAWRRKAEGFTYNRIAPLFGLYLNLEDPPCYRNRGADDALMVILGLDRVEQFEEIVEAHENGRIPANRVMWGSCPTRFDPSQAPGENHTAFLWEKLPYALEGNPDRWDSEMAAHGMRMLEAWSEAAPGLRASVTDFFTRSPLEVERTLPNMRFGDLLVGAFANDQVGYNRPFPGAGEYRTHLEGLYLCGSSCHPGGNVTGLPGYNAAATIGKDLGVSLREK
jgi:phytoene dehydrogenase-like protein